MSGFLDIGVLVDIFVQGVWLVRIVQGCIVVFCIVDDCVFVLDDCCLYKGGFLFEGIVYGISVICLLYNWVFDLNIGMVQGVDDGVVVIYFICVEVGCILIDVSLIYRIKVV